MKDPQATANRRRILDHRISVATRLDESGLSPAGFKKQNPDITESVGTLRGWADKFDPTNPRSLADRRWDVVSRRPSVIVGPVLGTMWTLWALFYDQIEPVALRISPKKAMEQIEVMLEKAGLAGSVAVPKRSTVREVLREFHRYLPNIGTEERTFRVLVESVLDRPPAYRGHVWHADSINFTRKKLSKLGFTTIYNEVTMEEVDVWAMQMIDAGSRYSIGVHCLPSRPTATDTKVFMRHCMLPDDAGRVKLYGQPKVVRLDKGGENSFEQLQPIFAALGTLLTYTPTATPKLNSKIERLHRTMLAVLKYLIASHPEDIQTVVLANGKTVRGMGIRTFARWLGKARAFYNSRGRRKFRMESPASAWRKMRDNAWEAKYDVEKIRRAFVSERRVTVSAGRLCIGNWVYQNTDLEPHKALTMRTLIGDEHREAEFYHGAEFIGSFRPDPLETIL